MTQRTSLEKFSDYLEEHNEIVMGIFNDVSAEEAEVVRIRSLIIEVYPGIQSLLVLLEDATLNREDMVAAGYANAALKFLENNH